ncbi:MAG: hypothetical protein JSS76_15340 [Bacteroidetes bacterium]|nr:hypothetical protein [Bacteroidota bacterium]
MDCLIDYIGLRTQGGTAPESGMYINDLPGITVSQITDIANSEHATFLDVWNTVQRRSAKYLRRHLPMRWLNATG